MGRPTDTDDRDRRLAERERALADARAALRAERDRVAADRAEADRLLAAAKAAHRDAVAARSRARRVAGRFAAGLEHRHARTRRDLDERAENLAAERARFAAEVGRFTAVRSEYHAAAAEARDRLRAAWAAVEAQQQRAAAEWAESDRYSTERAAALDARAADLEAREKAAGDLRARAEAETAGLREEAAALERRVQNARAALAELEHRRDRARAELLAPPAPVPAPDPGGNLTFREALLAREKAAVAALRAALDRETADADDRRRVLAEQVAQLADARARWQRAERQTVLEMEQLARALRHRERDLDAREQRLIRADARRRQDAYDLWQLRLRLETWQTRLTAFEARWHAEREQLEADLERRTAAVVRREAVLGATFARWEQARAADHARLRAELDHWAADRAGLARAAAAFDEYRREWLGELTAHAARALAAEQLLGEATPGESGLAARRLAVLRKRWEKVFDRKARAVEAARAEAAAERAVIDERYRELHSLLADMNERAGKADHDRASDDLAVALAPTPGFPPAPPSRPGAPSGELAALRSEVERLAAAVLEIDLPEPPDPPDAELPWAADDPAAVLPFDPASRAA